MNYLSLIFVLVAALALCVNAEPEPEPAKGQRAALPRFRLAGDAKEARKVESADDETDDVANADTNGKKDVTNKKGSDASSGRLFLKKFMLFKNMFGQQQQPVIPIIIAGNSGTGSYTTPTTSSPTYSTITSTGSLPTVTGTLTTSPTSTSRGDGLDRQEEEVLEEAAAAMDEEQLQAALAAGAQEYVVTDQEIRGTSDAKASKGPARVNLRRPGGKKGQMVSVRIPAKYRKYFKNGQKVMLNTNNRPGKRRTVQKKRVNKTRRRRVGGKRRRVNN
ncbi:uncharacterized protein LOC129237315 [Anastrepha obliqua]|uniref:uncharacterized protein LOC129237315 n=1 Tax=Anastrepha obliqua TaxID=95512 RepID=UPI002409A851|nr:uncharacterized protein LOC129237315 [Anastrepha obliqua]